MISVLCRNCGVETFDNAGQPACENCGWTGPKIPETKRDVIFQIVEQLREELEAFGMEWDYQYGTVIFAAVYKAAAEAREAALEEGAKGEKVGHVD